jgi:Na+/H+ antiporter
MHHGVELTAVLVASIALITGVATRLLSSRTRFPYTIAMLLLGIAGGIALEPAKDKLAGSAVLGLITHAAHISPDLIIFVFLPALLFESAYSIDTNVFKNNVGPIMLYAVPALVLATGLTAALMVGLASDAWGWGWPAALVFGALISATDPVAVVAILRELGVSKRLGVLIEGESLMNDGTAIVVFSLLLALLTGQQSQFELGPALLQFAWVACGGVAVGLLLAFLVTGWIGKLFNDPLAEITLTLVLAYAAMIIAEGLLHVSGVMAVVTTGLWMSASGKTKISPDVSHFLHRFWETLGYIANTLIFMLVGVVIGNELEQVELSDALLVLGAYFGVMVIRLVLVYAFQPLADRLGDGVSWSDSAVITWGGLRGAVSLALALIVAQNPLVEPQLGRQILLTTAGVVLLTIVINGTTISRLLASFGYDKPHLSAQVQQLTAQAIVLENVQNQLEQASDRADLKTCQWNEVFDSLTARRKRLREQLDEARAQLEHAPKHERVVATWRRVLSAERQAYWEAYNSGTLSADCVRTLTREISRQLDRVARGDFDPPETRLPKTIGAGWLQRLVGVGLSSFDKLMQTYDLSRAELLAAQEVLRGLEAFEGVDPELIAQIRKTYQSFQMRAKERIEDLRTNLPEVASAIETRLARRVKLNLEKEGYERLVHTGILNESTAHAHLHEVDERIHELHTSAERVAIPETAHLVASTPLFSTLDEQALQELADLTEEIVIPAGQTLFEEGDRGDSLFVIARGAMRVLKRIGDEQVVVDVLGGGDIIGEMALLTGEPRTATARAATAVTLGKVDREGFEHLMQSQPTLRQRIWREFQWRLFDNALRAHRSLGRLSQQLRRRWFDESTPKQLSAGQSSALDGTKAVFVATGTICLSETAFPGPKLLLEVRKGELQAVTDATWLELPAPPALSSILPERDSELPERWTETQIRERLDT